MRTPRPARLAVLAAGAALCACAGPTSSHRTALNASLAARDWKAAAARVEGAKLSEYGDKNAVLFDLDLAAVLHDAGRYQDSDAWLDRAELKMDALYTQSLTKGAATFLLNDAADDYRGEPHERALLHVLRALNYAYQGKTDDAVVEARKVTAFLAELSDRTGVKLTYRDDAFAQYLAALLFEDAGRADDARISRDAAVEAYGWYAGAYGVGLPDLAPVVAPAAVAPPAPASAPATPAPPTTPAAAASPAPPAVVPAVVPAVATVGEAPPAAEAADAFAAPPQPPPDAPPPPPPASIPAPPADPPPLAASSQGEVVLLHYNGPAPRRETQTFQVAWNEAAGFVHSSGEGEGDPRVKNALVAGIASDAITVAYPRQVQDPYRIRGSEIRVDGLRARTQLVEDVSAISARALDDRKGAVFGRMVARATVKYILSKAIESAVKKEAGEGLGLLAGILARSTAAATEVADTRCWATLPAQIRMARVRLPAGHHVLHVTYLDAHGAPVTAEDLPVEVAAGHRTWLHVRTAQ